jgi:hypothetical protein
MRFSKTILWIFQGENIGYAYSQCGCLDKNPVLYHCGVLNYFISLRIIAFLWQFVLRESDLKIFIYALMLKGVRIEDQICHPCTDADFGDYSAWN